MENYKLIAADLDGTLFDNRSELSSENARAIRTLAEKGVHFVPSTGRTFSDIREELRSNDDVRYFICSNGALVYDKKTGDSIFRCISGKTATDAIDIIYDFDVHVSARADGKCYTDNALYSKADFEAYHLCDAHVNVLESYAIPEDNFEEWMRRQDHIESVAVFFRSLDELFECNRRLAKIDGIRVIRQYEYNLELFSEKAGKGDALTALMDMLGIDRAESIAVGDSNNDISMIEAAGLGLAVSNACDSLKSVCHKTVCSNEEHVLDYILKQYF